MGAAPHAWAERVDDRALAAAREGVAVRPARLPYFLGALLMALLLAPYLAGLHGVPAGEGFRGTLWPIDDAAEYLAALRAGGQGAWLWHDPFMAHTPPSILMYPTYLAAGHAVAALGLSVPLGAALFAACCLAALFGALWLLASPFLPVADRGWCIAFALGASGCYWLDAALAVAGHAPLPVAMLASPSLSGFTMALLDAHRALGMAGALVGSAAVLRLAGRPSQWVALVALGALGITLLALDMPMLLPLFVPVLCLCGLRGFWRIVRAAHGRSAALALALAVWPAFVAAPFALYYLVIFAHGAWSGGIMTTVAAPPPLEFVLSMGVLLPGALWGWRQAPARSRPLADLLALWCCLAVAGRFAPLWQSVRLTDGLNVASGALIGLGVVGAVRGTRWRARLLMLAGLGTILYYLLLLADLGAGRAGALYTNHRETLALGWLAGHVTPRDVVLSSYRFGNIAPEACGCRVVVGHFQQTLDFAAGYPRVLRFFGAGLDNAAHMRMLRATGATLIVYDPIDAPEERFNPGTLPGARVVYAAAGVTIVRVP